MIGRTVFSTRKIVVSQILMAVKSCELGFETTHFVVKISVCIKGHFTVEVVEGLPYSFLWPCTGQSSEPQTIFGRVIQSPES